MRLFVFILIFYTRFSLASVFTDAIWEGNFTAIEELLEQGHKLEGHYGAVSDALDSGSLEMLIFVLKHGADPNAYANTPTYDGLRIRHVLNDAVTIYEIVALLSFGADPFGDDLWEFNHALYDKRWLHLVIYYYWEGRLMHTKPAPPNNISELNHILSSLPLLTINSLVIFIEHQLNLENLLSVLPTNLKLFLDYLNSRE